ncbi:MAG: YHYH domain-containing protein [Desulfovibrio sp.]|nr:YHYH domain-containing protein [Desulfovibrio sp.]
MPTSAFAHCGGPDAYGCHNDRKNGGYHCHKGPLAGEEFASQSEMLKALKASGTPTASRRKNNPLKNNPGNGGVIITSNHERNESNSCKCCQSAGR